ncbi:MAG: tetratricopeptide repeat protein [Terrimesophilobacter sp.]
MINIPPTQLRGAVDLSSLVREKPTADGAQVSPAEGAVSSLVMEGTDANFGQFLELSRSVAVIVELYAGAPSPTLQGVIRGYHGKFVLATVDARMNPQLAQAFQAVAAPTVAAVIAGRPIALYEGDLPEAEAKTVFDQVITLAAQNGVTGEARTTDAAEGVAEEPVEEPLPPHHQAAFDAIDRGDYATAISEYRTAIAQDPRDHLAIAGLAQVSLLDRLDGAVAEDLRAAAASEPGNAEAQLAVADLDVAGGHLDDAFGRLLELFPVLDQTGKDVLRARLLSYFEIAGADDQRVAAARRRLTSLLY